MVDTQEIRQALERKKSILAGDAVKVAKQHSAGKLTARERIGKLLDAGSFVETDALVSKKEDYSGVVTGYGTVEDRPVYVVAQDFTVHGGAMGVMQSKKICKVLDLAVRTGAPVVFFCDSAGVRIDEGAAAMNAFSAVYTKMAKMSGICPLICVIAGPVVGGAAIISELADISVEIEKTGELMVYGPTVVGSLTGKNLSAADVGGADKMMRQGAVALTAADEDAATGMLVRVLNLLPSCSGDAAEIIDTDNMNRLLSENTIGNASALISEIADCNDYIELKSGFGKEIRTVMCRIGGHSCGLLVCDSSVNDGMISADAAKKAARFVHFCDCYDLPIVSMIDSKGIAVPDEGHQAETMIAVSALLYAYASATSPKISVVTGKAIGQSYVAMAGKDNADMIYAWPGSVISALTSEAAVQVLHQDELKAGKSRFELEAAYTLEVSSSVNAAEAGLIDDICEPAETRKYIISALEMLENKNEPLPDRKHGNMPM